MIKCPLTGWQIEVTKCKWCDGRIFYFVTNKAPETHVGHCHEMFILRRRSRDSILRENITDKMISIEDSLKSFRIHRSLSQISLK